MFLLFFFIWKILSDILNKDIVLSLIKCGFIHLLGKYFECSGICLMFSERKLVWKQPILCKIANTAEKVWLYDVFLFSPNSGHLDQNKKYNKKHFICAKKTKTESNMMIFIFEGSLFMYRSLLYKYGLMIFQVLFYNYKLVMLILNYQHRYIQVYV